MQYSLWVPKWWWWWWWWWYDDDDNDDDDDDDDDDDGGGGGGGGGNGGDEDGYDGDIPREWWKFAYTVICDKYAQMKSLRLKMILSMDDPVCYKAYVCGDFAGTNLPHQISNLEQIAHLTIMITHANYIQR